MSSNTVVDSIAKARLVNKEAICEGSDTNKNYKAEWKKFKKFCQTHPEATIGSPWLTRDNIDLYFSVEVAMTRTGNRNSLRRIVWALQWFADHDEHLGESFDVESSAVNESIDSIVAQGKTSSNPGSDPHYGLKDALSLNDRLNIMRYIYRNRRDWADASVNFVYGHNGAVRGASNRSLLLSDLNMSWSFGPEPEGPLSRALLLVIRKGGAHKDRHEQDKQICFWRHRNYLLCSVFATAAHIITKLQGLDLEFKQPDKSKRPKWWDIPFLEWEKYNGKLLRDSDFYFN